MKARIRSFEGGLLGLPKQTAGRRFRRVAAAAGDGESSQPAAQLRLAVGIKNVPHPDKVSYGGEDAFFVSTVKGGLLGVADGVGGWEVQGISAADYSKTLMKVTESYLSKKLTPPPVETPTEEGEEPPPPPPSPDLTPMLLQTALDIAHRTTRVPGSSTSLIVGLDDARSKLVGLNLGDCSYIVVRDGQVVQESKPMLHSFDMPYQLGACPDFVEVTNYAFDGDEYQIDVQEGDVVVIASDGMWDNVFTDELLTLLPLSADDAQASADRIASTAITHANDDDFKSPYTTQALEKGVDLPFWEKLKGAKLVDGKIELPKLQGGKVDDITVLVAVVTSSDSAAAVQSRSNNFETIETADLKAGKGLEVKV